MPNPNGFEVCRQLKAHAETRDIPIVFLSAAREVEERLEGLRLGAVDFITKPFHREELLARVRTHLELGRLRNNLEKEVAERTEQLRESEARFRNIADTAPVGIWMTGRDGLLSFSNKSALEFLGRTMAQIDGTTGYEHVHPEDRAGLQRLISSSYAELSLIDAEFRVGRRDGTYRWVLCRGVPRFDSTAVFAGYIGSFVDVTDVKLAREEAIARQKMESLGVLAGGVAHDFNNILGGILGQAELMEEELPLGSPLSEEIQRIKTAAVHGSEIVRELMIYSGRDTKDFESVDISRLVEEMLELLKASISKRVTLKFDRGENLPEAWGHAPQIRQVVMNLIINASEAIGEDEGVIQVTTSRVAGRDLVSGSAVGSSEGEYVLLKISDTGCGLTEEQKARIFDPFFTTKLDGRGLGLSVVHGIVHSHRGAIHVASNPGQGATFQVYLGCTSHSANGEHRIEDTSPRETYSLAGRAVLVVEDEESLRHSLARMLRMKGFSVVEAADGSAAIDLLRKTKYSLDVILLDLTIPGASSRAVIDEAQRIKTDTKLVVMSAHSRESAERSLKMSISAFLRKPFQFGDLLQILRETLYPTESTARSQSA
jgi:PAS domain S-box-containing protein